MMPLMLRSKQRWQIYSAKTTLTHHSTRQRRTKAILKIIHRRNKRFLVPSDRVAGDGYDKQVDEEVESRNPTIIPNCDKVEEWGYVKPLTESIGPGARAVTGQI